MIFALVVNIIDLQFVSRQHGYATKPMLTLLRYEQAGDFSEAARWALSRLEALSDLLPPLLA